MLNNKSLESIAQSINNLAASVDRYTTLQSYAELYKCGMISENEFKEALEAIRMPSFIFKVPKVGKVATYDVVIGKGDSE